jgi:tetratricopeptide (TPR) repeat protein
VSQDEKSKFANVDLGSLARNSENIRLEQNIGEASYLPAVYDERDSSSKQTNIEEIRSSKTHSSDATTKSRVAVITSLSPRSRKESRVPLSGMLLALWLMVLCYLGGTIELGRTMILANLMQTFFSNPPTVANMLTQNDLAALLWAKGSFADAYKREQKSIDIATAAYGPNDQRTILAKLNLALLYFQSGNETETRKIWQAALPYLDKPQAGAPKEMTDVLLRLARDYDGKDPEVARSLYLATLNFWPNGAGSDTISNVRQELAMVDEELGRVAEANENMRKAFTAFERSGDTAYNQFRLYHIATTYNKLGKFQEAESFAQRALDMAVRMYGAGSRDAYDARLELDAARAGLGAKKAAAKRWTRNYKSRAGDQIDSRPN